MSRLTLATIALAALAPVASFAQSYEYQAASMPTYNETIRTTMNPSTTIYMPYDDTTVDSQQSDSSSDALRQMLTSAGN